MNWTRFVVKASRGGGAVTDRETGMVCDKPAHGLGARQVTTIPVVSGVDGPRLIAPGSTETPMLPGVELPLVTSSQDTTGVVTTE